MTPTEKVADTNQVTEFRPISVLPVQSKIAEKWLKEIISPFLFANPDWNQFGFTAGRSAEDALAALQFYVTAGFNSCPGVTRSAVVSLDVKKAFDSVPNNKLVQ